MSAIKQLKFKWLYIPVIINLRINQTVSFALQNDFSQIVTTFSQSHHHSASMVMLWILFRSAMLWYMSGSIWGAKASLKTNNASLDILLWNQYDNAPKSNLKHNLPADFRALIKVQLHWHLWRYGRVWMLFFQIEKIKLTSQFLQQVKIEVTYSSRRTTVQNNIYLW